MKGCVDICSEIFSTLSFINRRLCDTGYCHSYFFISLAHIHLRITNTRHEKLGMLLEFLIHRTPVEEGHTMSSRKHTHKRI